MRIMPPWQGDLRLAATMEHQALQGSASEPHWRMPDFEAPNSTGR